MNPNRTDIKQIKKVKGGSASGTDEAARKSIEQKQLRERVHKAVRDMLGLDPKNKVISVTLDYKGVFHPEEKRPAVMGIHIALHDDFVVKMDDLVKREKLQMNEEYTEAVKKVERRKLIVSKK